MKFLLIRHGVTDWNFEGRLQGREDIPLNSIGLAQSESCAAALDGLHVNKIITSPLLRAVKTAEIIAAHTGGEIVIEDDLTERDYGELSGTIPDTFDIFRPNENAAGLEPLIDTGTRFLNVMQRHVDDGEVVPIVSHGGAINAALRVISGRIKRLHLYNGGFCIVECYRGYFYPLRLNIPAEDFSLDML